MSVAGKSPEIARRANDCDQIPNGFVEIGTSSSAGSVDLRALPYLPARLTYEFTGVDATAIPEGTVVVIGGLDFATDEDAAIDGTTVQVGLTAVVAGRNASLAEGDAGALDAPISDIADAGEVVEVVDRGTTLDCGGKRVRLQAASQNATVLRGDHADTIVAGEGLVVVTTDNPLKSFFVDPGAGVDNTLTHIAGGTGKLRVLFSDDI